jgi:hypothetical protein
LLNSVRGTFKFWHEHYNAACAYALPLQDTTTPMSAEDRAEYAEKAVCRLKRATARADSAYLASRRDWLLSEDPDLKGLRRTDEFRRFEVIYLPSAKATARRPRDVQHLENSRYVKALLVTTAQRWQQVWHERARRLTSAPDIHELLEWFTDELRMWEHVRDIARDFRHLRTRLALIQDVAECADKYGFKPLAVAFPRYEDDPLDEGDDDACEVAARTELKNRENRLRALSQELCAHTPSEPAITLLDDLTRWQATLRYFDATAKTPSQYLLAQLCDHHAAMWQLLEQWLTVPNGSDPAARRRFKDKAKDTRRLWYTAQTGWGHLRDAWRARSDTDDTSRLPLPRALRVQMIGTWSHVRVSAGERKHRRQNGRVAVTVDERITP